jgi:hypothetical protein
LYEGRHPGEAIITEAKASISRNAVIIPPDTAVEMNALLGRVFVPSQLTTSTTQSPGNVGDGTMALSEPPVGDRVQPGVYTVTCIEPAPDGGIFLVRSPEGIEIGSARAGELFDGMLKFTINVGASDFQTGDGFTVKVAITLDGYHYVPFDPTANDGSEVPVAHSVDQIENTPGMKMAWAICRIATLSGSMIVWPANITEGQKAAAIRALAIREIFVV